MSEAHALGFRGMTLQENSPRDSRNTDHKVHCHSSFTNRNQIYNFKGHAPGVSDLKKGEA